MKKYIQIFITFDRVYRLFMSHVKFILERLNVSNISAVQAVIIYNIGVTHTAVTVGDLTRNFYYLGSNPGYAIRKLINSGYLVYSKSEYDSRICYVGLSPTGEKLFQALEEQLALKESIEKEKMDRFNTFLKSLECYFIAHT